MSTFDERRADRWVANLAEPKRRYVDGLRNEIITLREKLRDKVKKVEQLEIQLSGARNDTRRLRAELEDHLRALRTSETNR